LICIDWRKAQCLTFCGENFCVGSIGLQIVRTDRLEVGGIVAFIFRGRTADQTCSDRSETEFR